jgi:acyl-CoA dehydrogenase
MEFQSYAYGQNHWDLDADLPVVLARYWPELKRHGEELHRFGALVGREAYEVAYHVDRDARPVLVMHDLDGNRVDRVRLSPAEHALLKQLAPMMRPPYEGGSWHHHYAMGYLLGDPGLGCILTITQQTVYVIHKYAPEHSGWKDRLLSGECWGATWMTESHAGSDLGANQTVARADGEVWRLSGDKYFASGAGLTDIALVTAHCEGSAAGAKGLSLFLVPRLDRKDKLNFTVRRLKDKSATRAVPSGEVELSNSEGYLVGKADEGIYYAMEDLTVSRLSNAAFAMGLAKKAQLEALFRAHRRSAFGRVIKDHPLMRRDLTDLAVRMAGGIALTFHAVEAFERAWLERPPYSESYHYGRLLSHLTKNRTADHCAEITRLAMEIFGGLGFLDEYAVARWHREALITPIWEGSSNIQALEMLETLHKKNVGELFIAAFAGMLGAAATPEAKAARQSLERALAHLTTLGRIAAEWFSKKALNGLADAATVALLYELAETGGERYAKLANLYAHRFLMDEEYPSWAFEDSDIWRTGSEKTWTNDA